MKKTTLSIFGTLAMTIGLWATVPYTFTANTPAKASEVNSNFQSLSDKLTTLESNVSNNTTAIQSAASCNIPVFSYTYQYTPSDIGDTVIIRGVEYIMVALPFIEHGTGDKYYIKKPIVKTINSNNIDLSIYLTTDYVQEGISCYTSSFSGFPANYNQGIYYSNAYSASIADPANSYSAFNIRNSATHWITIKINQTNLSLLVSLSTELQNTPITSGDVDLRDDITWSSLANDSSLVDDVRILMNYIEIVKIP